MKGKFKNTHDIAALADNELFWMETNIGEGMRIYPAYFRWNDDEEHREYVLVGEDFSEEIDYNLFRSGFATAYKCFRPDSDVYKKAVEHDRLLECLNSYGFTFEAGV